jgi:hypothetical protein
MRVVVQGKGRLWNTKRLKLTMMDFVAQRICRQFLSLIIKPPFKIPWPTSSMQTLVGPKHRTSKTKKKLIIRLGCQFGGANGTNQMVDLGFLLTCNASKVFGYTNRLPPLFRNCEHYVVFW